MIWKAERRMGWGKSEMCPGIGANISIFFDLFKTQNPKPNPRNQHMSKPKFGGIEIQIIAPTRRHINRKNLERNLAAVERELQIRIMMKRITRAYEDADDLELQRTAMEALTDG